MVTRKAVKRVATKRSILRFDPDWVKDEVPPWVRLDRAILRELNSAKRDFGKRVNEILAKARQ